MIVEQIHHPIKNSNNANLQKLSNGSPYVCELEDVKIGYKSKNILSNINLKMPNGSCWAIIGPSGSGKTTLFKLITGLLSPKHGEVSVLGYKLNGKKSKAKQLQGKTGYIPQNLGLVQNSDVLTNILLGSLGRTPTALSILGLIPYKEHLLAQEVMKQLSIDHLAKNNVRTLSGGERRRVAIARALLQNPDLLIADELLSELDTFSAQKVMSSIKQYQNEKGASVILIEHNIEAAMKFAEKLVIINHGTIQAILDTKNIISMDEVYCHFNDMDDVDAEK
jgi:phosphonate transport system ATP-binding protein